MVDKSVNQNPFEFGIIQRVRRWFGREPVKITIDIGGGASAQFAANGLKKIINEINSVLPPVKTETLMPECKEPKSIYGGSYFEARQNVRMREAEKNIDCSMQQHKEKVEAMALSVKNALDELQYSRAALIAVIKQWGPITFADETIEANKKKKISIKRENGFVKFSIGESNDQRTNETAAGVQRFSVDDGESGDGSTKGQLQADASEAPRCDSGRVWYDFKYSESDLPRD